MRHYTFAAMCVCDQNLFGVCSDLCCPDRLVQYILRVQLMDSSTAAYWFKVSIAFVIDNVNSRTSIQDLLGDRSSLTHVERSNKIKSARFDDVPHMSAPSHHSLAA